MVYTQNSLEKVFYIFKIVTVSTLIQNNKA